MNNCDFCRIVPSEREDDCAFVRCMCCVPELCSPRSTRAVRVPSVGRMDRVVHAMSTVREERSRVGFCLSCSSSLLYTRLTAVWRAWEQTWKQDEYVGEVEFYAGLTKCSCIAGAGAVLAQRRRALICAVL